MSAHKTQVSILVCGGPYGKTALVQRYIEGDFKEEYTSTSAIIRSTKTIEVGSNEVELVICDSCTEHIMKKADHLRRKDGFIVLFDVTNYESFVNCRTFFDAIKQHADRKTLPILVGNKTDLEKERAVSELEAKDFARELDIPYIETSAKNGANVQELFRMVLTNTIMPSNGVVKRQWTPQKIPMCSNPRGCKCVIS